MVLLAPMVSVVVLCTVLAALQVVEDELPPFQVKLVPVFTITPPTVLPDALVVKVLLPAPDVGV